eukprot:2976705-Pleurochrysis_carterae.AAC.1
MKSPLERWHEELGNSHRPVGEAEEVLLQAPVISPLRCHGLSTISSVPVSSECSRGSPLAGDISAEKALTYVFAAGGLSM